MQEYTPEEALAQQTLAPDAAAAEAEPVVPAAEAEPAPEIPEEPAPVTVVDVRFRNNAKSYFFDPDGMTIAAGTHVVIDTARGDEFGTCVAGNHDVKPRELVLPLRKVLRIATAQDERTNADNQEKEKRAFDICQQKIAAHGLEMQLVSAECAFDGSKLLFFFTAEGRVDFRELVKDLASVFRTRIELRQIGVRDKAKMVGGLGVCGRPFCCKEFLDDFQPVSIKMAKTQNLSLNPTKISGTCGRLMCCLKYEQAAYEDLIKTAPKAESFVDTPDGRGTVVEVNLLRQSVKVRMEDHPETIGVYKNADIYVIRNGKARKTDPPIPRDLAPISSRPRPAAKKEVFFEELPELIYNDDVAVVESESDAPAAEEESAEGKTAPRKRRRGGRRSKPASERTPDAAAPENPARPEKPKKEQPSKKEQPRRERPPQEKKTAERQPRQPAADAAPAADTPKPRRRRRRGGTGRKPAGDQPPKAE